MRLKHILIIAIAKLVVQKASSQEFTGSPRPVSRAHALTVTGDTLTDPRLAGDDATERHRKLNGITTTGLP